MGEIWVMNPTGVNLVESRGIAPRLATLEGARLGLLNNNKPNSQLLQDHIVELLSENARLKGVLRKQKPNAAVGAEGLDAYSNEVQAVITAIGD